MREVGGTLRYDVVIVGLGPAGSYCLNFLSKAGFKVVGLDRSVELGEKPCGEAVPKDFFEHLHFKPHEICSNPIRRGIILVGDDLKVLDFGNIEGYIIDKKRLLSMLVEEAEGYGAEAKLGTRVLEVDDKGRAVLANGEILEGEVVICADGVSGPSTRYFKHPHYIGAYQYRLEGRLGPEDAIYLAFREELDGYMWAFPKSNKLWNVGAGGLKVDAKNYSLKIVELLFKGREWKIIGRGGGAIPIFGPLERACKGRLVAVGDRYATSMSLSGEGIRPAIVSAKFACHKIVDFLSNRSGELDYSREFMREWGWRITSSGKILKSILRTPRILRPLLFRRINVRNAKKLLNGEYSGAILKFG